MAEKIGTPCNEVVKAYSGVVTVMDLTADIQRFNFGRKFQAAQIFPSRMVQQKDPGTLPSFSDGSINLPSKRVLDALNLTGVKISKMLFGTFQIGDVQNTFEGSR